MAAHQAIAETAFDDKETEFVDELKPGTTLMHGQYTIVNFLNSGGFGITYLAKDSLDRIVVIKECFPGNVCRRQGASVQPRSRAHQTELKSIVALFTREAQNLAKADHPNIVGVHNVFEYNNTAYMALDYVKGRDLLDTIIEAPETLSPDRIVRYLGNLLNAIGFIHGKSILHRDISPDNIIINEHDEPVLIDFGAAREQASKKSRVLSQLRVVKDGYSPQEFYISGSEQTESSDLYSLAASFYHVITGDLPPDSQKRITAFASDEPDPYIPLGKRTTDYSPAFCAALDKAMSVLPKDRVSSADEWLGILEGTLPVPSSNDSRSELSPAASYGSQSSGSKLPVLLGSTAVVAILGAGMFFALNTSEELSEAEPITVVELFTPQVQTTVPAILAEPSAVAQPAATAFSDESVQPTLAAIGLPGASTPGAFENRSEAPEPPAPVVEAAPAPVAEAAPAPVAEAAPVPVAEPSGTVGFENAGVPDSAPAAPAAAPVNEPVTTSATLKLPFTLSETETGVIATVDAEARFWMKEGVQISTVDGEPLTGSAQLIAALTNATPDARGMASVKVGTKQPNSDIEITRTLNVPLVDSIALSNGMTFETRPVDGAWITVASAVPSGSEIQIGDRIVGYVQTNELVNGPTTFADITRRELAEGRSNLAFAFDRDGDLWVTNINLLPPSN